MEAASLLDRRPSAPAGHVLQLGLEPGAGGGRGAVWGSLRKYWIPDQGRDPTSCQGLGSREKGFGVLGRGSDPALARPWHWTTPNSARPAWLKAPRWPGPTAHGRVCRALEAGVRGGRWPLPALPSLPVLPATSAPRRLLPPPPAQLQALLPSCLQPPVAPYPSGNKTRSPASSSAQPCPPPPSPPTCSLVQPQTRPFPPPSPPPAPTTLAHGLGSPHYLVSFSVSLPLRRDRPFPLCHLSASRPAPAELLDGHRVRGWTSAVFP